MVMRDNRAMRERVMINLSIIAALGVLVLGFAAGWAFATIIYSALGTLVLGLAANRLVAFISARSSRTEKGDS